MSSSVAKVLVDAGVNLCMLYGATEVGPISIPFSQRRETSDWEYIEFNPSVVMRWISKADGMYEGVLGI